MRIYPTFCQHAVEEEIQGSVKIEEEGQTMAETVIEKENTTAKEMVMMTPEVVAGAHEGKIEEETQVVAEVTLNPSLIEILVHQRAKEEAEDAVVITRGSRETIMPADESNIAASETGFDILQTCNAAYDWPREIDVLSSP